MNLTFDDDYPTCLETHVTLRVFSKTLTPSAITHALKVQPSDSFSMGQPYGKKELLRRETGWLLSSKNTVKSRDTRRHVAWILEQLREKQASVQTPMQMGAEIDLSCYYVSVGQGGPTMCAEQMSELGKLGLDVCWDIYFDSASNYQ